MSAVQDLIDTLSIVVEHLQLADQRAGDAARVTVDAHHLATAVGAAVDLQDVRDLEDLHVAVASARATARDTVAPHPDHPAGRPRRTPRIPSERATPHHRHLDARR